MAEERRFNMNIKELSIDTKSILIGSAISIVLILVNAPLLAWFFGPVVGAFLSNFFKREFNVKYSLMVGLVIGVVFMLFYLIYSIAVHGGQVSLPNWNSILLLTEAVLIRIIAAVIYGLVGGLIAYVSIRIFNTNKKSGSS